MSEEMIVIDNRSDEIKLVNQKQVFLYVKNCHGPRDFSFLQETN